MLLKSKSRSVRDLYLQYPYKKNPPFTNTIPVPYIKQKDVSDHKWAITYAEYNEVIDTFADEIIKLLQDGDEWQIGSNMGVISLRKIKCKSFIDRIASKEQGKRVTRIRNNYENYMLVTAWDRAKYALRNKWLWRFKLIPKVLRDIYLKTDEDFTYIFKFKDK